MRQPAAQSTSAKHRQNRITAFSITPPRGTDQKQLARHYTSMHNNADFLFIFFLLFFFIADPAEISSALTDMCATRITKITKRIINNG